MRWGFRAGEPGDISYDLAQSDTQITQDGFAPYRTDWRLQQSVDGGSWESIHAGIHTPVNLQDESDAVSVSGKDWSHWLEQPVWFEYYDFNWDQAGASFATRRRDIVKGDHTVTAGVFDEIAVLAFTPPATYSDAITELINNTKRGTDYVNITPSYQGTSGSSTLEVQSYVIYFQDRTTVLQHINNIAALDDPYGFDWTMNFNKTMEFFGPRKNVSPSTSILWTIDKSAMVEQPLDALNWTNNGPLGTHVVGLSIGSPALWWKKRDQDSVDKFREWLVIEEVGDRYIKGADMRFAVDGLDYIHPQKDISITVLPEVLSPSQGFKNHIGDIVRLKWFFEPYHEVNAFYWITGQEFYGDAPGNMKCDLSLQQIYD